MKYNAEGATADMRTARKAFHIGDVFAMLLGDSVSPRGAAGVLALGEHLAGESLTPAGCEAYRPQFVQIILQQYPELGTLMADPVPPAEFVSVWLTRRAAEFGEYLAIAPATRATETAET